MSKATQVLAEVQAEIHAPKNLNNAFAGFAYRNAEGIYDALKPLLASRGASVVVPVVRNYVDGHIFADATAILTAEDGSTVTATAFAEVDLNKKGNDASQRCGAAHSYAAKYALCALFAIGTGDDPDADDNREIAPAPAKKPATKRPTKAEPVFSDLLAEYESAVKACAVRKGLSADEMRAKQIQYYGKGPVEQWDAATLRDAISKMTAPKGA